MTDGLGRRLPKLFIVDPKIKVLREESGDFNRRNNFRRNLNRRNDFRQILNRWNDLWQVSWINWESFHNGQRGFCRSSGYWTNLRNFRSKRRERSDCNNRGWFNRWGKNFLIRWRNKNA